jgi:hypothetical protein
VLTEQTRVCDEYRLASMCQACAEEEQRGTHYIRNSNRRHRSKMRVRTVFGGLRQFGAVFGGLWRPVIVIIPKSKDQFMERPPIKTVQP